MIYPNYDAGVMKGKHDVNTLMHYTTRLRIKHKNKYYLTLFYAEQIVKNDTPIEIIEAIRILNTMAYYQLIETKVDTKLTNVHGNRIFILDNNQNE